MNETFHFARNDLISRGSLPAQFYQYLKVMNTGRGNGQQFGLKISSVISKKKVQLQTYKIFFLKFAWRMTSSKKTND